MSRAISEIGRMGAILGVGAMVLALGCESVPQTGSPTESPVTTTRSALSSSGVTSANLQLQVSKNACAANLAQDYFEVTNSTGSALPLSQISIKYWINDTSAAPIVPAVFYGGCVTTPNGTCVHPVTGVTATATRFAPACGPDANHQASWEITLATTDTTPLSPGQTWSNLQTAVNLSTWAPFAPGTSTWFSACGTGQPYAPDPHFAVYDNGDLVESAGLAVPICRAPQAVQIQAFIDAAYYSSGDIRSSFVASGQQVDCIDFGAQHSVKAWTAAGVAVPTAAPPAPPTPAGMAPPNFPPGSTFTGQPDVNGNPESCGSGQVPVSRPTVADVQAAGGVTAFLQAQTARNRLLAGSQDLAEHDCWLNTAPGSGGPIGTVNAVDWEHAAGEQTSGFLPSGAPGFFGAHTIASIYAPVVVQSPFANVTGAEHTDSQFWVQTGGCENWYNDSAQAGGEANNACQLGSACTTCSGAACQGCAVQSLEVAALQNGGDVPRLALFFTTDGYFIRTCFAGDVCTGCPTTATAVTPPGSGTLTEGTDCFVAWPGAKLKPNAPLPVNGSGAGQYGVIPNEVEFQVWNGAGTSTPGWWVYVNSNLIGWYPPQTFNWPDGSTGALSNGPATYLQAGGEVFDSWPGGKHTDTAMVSDNAAQSGFEFAAYQRNMGYYDTTKGFHDSALGYPVAPSSEGDDGIPGVCGTDSGSWTDQNGAAGGYTLSTTTPAGGANWGQYVYFGGGRLANEIGPTRNPVTITYHQYAACSVIPTSTGVVTVGPKTAYVVFMIDSIDNSANNTAFNFDQTKIFTPDRHDGLSDFVDPGLSIYPDIFGPFAVANGPIAAGFDERFEVDADISLVVTTTTSDGTVEADQTVYPLEYQSQPGDPPVTMVNSNPSQTTFPIGQADCTQIGLTI